MGVARRLALLQLLALAACADVSRGRDATQYDEWRHPTKEPMEVRSDRAECERFHGATEREQDNCLKAKGWTKVEKKGFSLF